MIIDGINYYYSPNTTTTMIDSDLAKYVLGDWNTDSTTYTYSDTYSTRYKTQDYFEELAMTPTMKWTKDGKQIELTYWEVFMLKQYGVVIEDTMYKDLSKYLVEMKL